GGGTIARGRRGGARAGDAPGREREGRAPLAPRGSAARLRTVRLRPRDTARRREFPSPETGYPSPASGEDTRMAVRYEISPAEGESGRERSPGIARAVEAA